MGSTVCPWHTVRSGRARPCLLSLSSSLTIGYQYTTQVPCPLFTLVSPPPNPEYPEQATSTGHHWRVSAHVDVS